MSIDNEEHGGIAGKKIQSPDRKYVLQIVGGPLCPGILIPKKWKFGDIKFWPKMPGSQFQTGRGKLSSMHAWTKKMSPVRSSIFVLSVSITNQTPFPGYEKKTLVLRERGVGYWYLSFSLSLTHTHTHTHSLSSSEEMFSQFFKLCSERERKNELEGKIYHHWSQSVFTKETGFKRADFPLYLLMFSTFFSLSCQWLSLRLYAWTSSKCFDHGTLRKTGLEVTSFQCSLFSRHIPGVAVIPSTFGHTQIADWPACLAAIKTNSGPRNGWKPARSFLPEHNLFWRSWHLCGKEVPLSTELKRLY